MYIGTSAHPPHLLAWSRVVCEVHLAVPRTLYDHSLAKGVAATYTGYDSNPREYTYWKLPVWVCCYSLSHYIGNMAESIWSPGYILVPQQQYNWIFYSYILVDNLHMNTRSTPAGDLLLGLPQINHRNSRIPRIPLQMDNENVNQHGKKVCCYSLSHYIGTATHSFRIYAWHL